MMERILEDTFVPDFDSRKNVASPPSSMLERASSFFEHSSLLILFFTPRKKIATFSYLCLFVSILLRNFAK